MSKTLSAFMRSNVAPITNHFYAASPRFKGEDGKPMAWEICCISADEYARIRAACIKQVPIPGKKNQYTQQLDTYAFQAKVCARCTVFPTLTTPNSRTIGALQSRRNCLAKCSSAVSLMTT